MQRLVIGKIRNEGKSKFKGNIILLLILVHPKNLSMNLKQHGKH